MAHFHFQAFFQSSRTFTKQPDLLKIIRSGLRFPQQLLSYQVPAVGNLLVSPPVLPSQCCFGAQLQLIQMLHWTKFPVPPLLPSLWTYSMAVKLQIKQDMLSWCQCHASSLHHHRPSQSISQSHKHRLCLLFLHYAYEFRFWYLQCLGEDAVALLITSEAVQSAADCLLQHIYLEAQILQSTCTSCRQGHCTLTPASRRGLRHLPTWGCREQHPALEAQSVLRFLICWDSCSSRWLGIAPCSTIAKQCPWQFLIPRCTNCSLWWLCSRPGSYLHALLHFLKGCWAPPNESAGNISLKAPFVQKVDNKLVSSCHSLLAVTASCSHSLHKLQEPWSSLKSSYHSTENLAYLKW